MDHLPSLYLDHNATSVIDPRVVESMWPILSGPPVNPSSSHHCGQRARSLLVKATRSIAQHLDVSPQDIIYTSGATEGLNMIIKGLSSTFAKGHIISSAYEHSAVYETLKALEKQGWEVSFLSHEGRGSIQGDDVIKALRPDTRLIVVMAANNETGIHTDLHEIASIAESVHIPLVVDAVGLLGRAFWEMPKGVQAFCISGHKIHGPQGIGLAVVKGKKRMPPFITGGPQQQGKRGGTENLAGIIGLSKALELCMEEQAYFLPKIETMRNAFESELENLFPVIIHGKNEKRVVNTSQIAFPSVNGETLLMLLDQQGICVSQGSACSSGGIEPSRVLLSMGIPLEIVRSSIRFSMSKFTSMEEIHQALHVIKNVISQLLAIQV